MAPTTGSMASTEQGKLVPNFSLENTSNKKNPKIDVFQSKEWKKKKQKPIHFKPGALVVITNKRHSANPASKTTLPVVKASCLGVPAGASKERGRRCNGGFILFIYFVSCTVGLLTRRSFDRGERRMPCDAVRTRQTL